MRLPGSSTRAVLAALKTLSKYLKPHAPIRRAEMFLQIAEFGPITLEELARSMRTPAGTAYDNLRALGKVDASGKEGARLINTLPAEPDSTAHRYVLSVRGTNAIDTLQFMIAAAMLD